MYTTIYNVLVSDVIVAYGLSSLSEAEVVKNSWLNFFPDLDVSIYSRLVPCNVGDFHA